MMMLNKNISKYLLVYIGFIFFIINNLNAQYNIALTADSILTSHVSPWETLYSVNDGYDPLSSSDKTGGAYGNWESNANADWEWIEYNWDELKNIYQSDIYWWNDGQGIQFPTSTYHMYWDVISKEWKTLPNITGNGVEGDQYNITCFDTILTNKIRVYAISTIATGILEWKVWGKTGEQIPMGSVCEIDNALTISDTSNILIAARDASGNPVIGYVFKLDINISDQVPSVDEEYMINNTSFSGNDTIITTPATNAQGETVCQVIMPSEINPTDGITLRVLFHNSISQIGDTFSLIMPGLTSPSLNADFTDNNVDNQIQISFTDDVTWRNAITGIMIGNEELKAGTDYEITSGIITLKPSGGNKILTVTGTKNIQVKAIGYRDATVNQTILPGTVDPGKCQIRTVLNLYRHTTTDIEITACDQYNNIISDYSFKYNVTITNATNTTSESYIIGTSSVTSNLSDQSLIATDDKGTAILKIGIPGTVDLNDGITVQFVLQNNTLVSPAITYINDGTEKNINLQSAVKNNPDFTWDNSAQSENFVIFWGKKITGNPTDAANGNLAFDPVNILDILEKLLYYMTDSIGFIDNANQRNMATYKHEIVMNETWTNGSFTGWAFGGAADNKIGGIWIHPSATNGPDVLAHEFTHACQSMVLLQYPGYGLNASYAGFFWESHANYYMAQYTQTYTGVQIDRYINTAMLHFSTTRHYYQNLYFIDHLADKYGIDTTHLIWRKASPTVSHPLTSLRDSVLHFTQDDLNNEFIEMAMKNVTWDYHNGFLIRSAIKSMNQMYIGREYTILDEVIGMEGTYVVPQHLAPGDYGYNIIPLFPDNGASEISLTFTGYDNEPAGGAGWRYGFVAVDSKGIPRYSDYYNSQTTTVNFPLEASDSTIFLVVTGSPDKHHNYGWTTGFPKEYRYPYSIKLTGALPAGHKENYNSLKDKYSGTSHTNGGGWVASTATVAQTVYVGPNAQILENATISGYARIEDYAIIKGTASISGSAIVKDNAIVGGTSNLRTNVKVEKSARVYNSTLSNNVVITGSAMVLNSTISGNAIIKDLAYLSGVSLSGTVIVGGDAEEYTSCSSGTYLQMQTVRTSGCDGLIYHQLNNDINPDWEIYQYPLGYTPTTPMNLSSSNITAETVDLKWDESLSNNTLAGYYILANGKVVMTVDTTYVTVTGLSPNTSYKITVQAIDKSGNVSDQSNSISVKTDISNINDLSGESISIYPNPTSDYFHIKITNTETSTVKVVNLSGIVVFKQSFNKELSIDKSMIGGAGLYIIEINNNNKVYFNRLVVQ